MSVTQRLVLLVLDASMTAVDSKTGTPLWRVSFDEVPSLPVRRGPPIVGSKAYITVGSKVLEIDLRAGEKTREIPGGIIDGAFGEVLVWHDRQTVTAYHIGLGKKVWSVDVPNVQRVVVTNESVYVTGGQKRLRKLALADGRAAWESDFGREVGGVEGRANATNAGVLDDDTGSPTWAYALGEQPALPTIRNGVVYRSHRGLFTAHRAKSGEAIFSVRCGFRGRPVIHDDLVLLTEEELYALDGESGEVIWKTSLPPDENWELGTPQVAGDQAYVHRSDGRLYAIRLPSSRDAKTALPTETALRWSQRLSGAVSTRITLPQSDSSSLVVGADQWLYGLTTKTGEVRWRHKMQLPSQEPAQILVDDDLVIALAPSGLIARHSDSGKVRWRFKSKGSRRLRSMTRQHDRIVVAHEDGTSRIIDPKTGREVRKLRGQSDRVMYDGARTYRVTGDYGNRIVASKRKRRLWEKKWSRESTGARILAASAGNLLIDPPGDEAPTTVIDGRTGKDVFELVEGEAQPELERWKLSDDILYMPFTRLHEKFGANRVILVAYDMKSGEAMFKQDVGNGSAGAVRAVGKHHVLMMMRGVNTVSDYAWAWLDKKDGAVKWRVVDEPNEPPCTYGALGAGAIYLACDRKLRELNATDGTTVWSAISEEPIAAAPTASAESIWFGTTAGSVFALDLGAMRRTGDLAFEAPSKPPDEEATETVDLCGSPRSLQKKGRTGTCVVKGVKSVAAGAHIKLRAVGKKTHTYVCEAMWCDERLRDRDVSEYANWKLQLHWEVKKLYSSKSRRAPKEVATIQKVEEIQ